MAASDTTDYLLPSVWWHVTGTSRIPLVVRKLYIDPVPPPPPSDHYQDHYQEEEETGAPISVMSTT